MFSTCRYSSTMRLLASSVLLLCLSAYSEGTVISKEPGGSIDLTCSSDGCPNTTVGYNFLYLNYEFNKVEEVVFSNIQSKRNAPRSKYMNRIQLNVSTRTITLSNLEETDTGIYKCVYKKSSAESMTCSIFAVFITERTPCSTVSPIVEKQPPLLYIIFVCIISVLAMWVFLLLIIPRVEQRCKKRRAMYVHAASGDNVYETMRRDEGAQVAAQI